MLRGFTATRANQCASLPITHLPSPNHSCDIMEDDETSQMLSFSVTTFLLIPIARF